MYDILIIGSGVIGSSISRELSKYNLNIAVIEKNEDVATGISKANSGIVHAGFHFNDNSLKSTLNLEGSRLFKELSEKLDFSYKQNGALVLAFSSDDLKTLEKFKENGEKQGLKVSLLSREEALEIEPNLNKDVIKALYCPDSAIVNPYEMNLALAENAATNGVEFIFNTEVLNIKKLKDKFLVETTKGTLESAMVINAAGLYSDAINNMVSKTKFHITPIKGEYVLFDKVAGSMIKSTLYPVPNKISKGVLVTPSCDGNLLIGPNAEETSCKENLNTCHETINYIINEGKKYIKDVPVNRIITNFSGLRPHLDGEKDFVIGEASDVSNFINVIGIESPGLTAAPAIGKMVTTIVLNKLDASMKNDFIEARKGIIKFTSLSLEEKNRLISENPLYGKIICQCEMITEGEVVDSINRPLGATTLDGVKRRTRATMGGCQGTGCMLPVIKILARELSIPVTEIHKNTDNSFILTE